MRLDRFLAKTLNESRTNVKKLIRSRQIRVNDEVITSESYHVDTALDKVFFDNQELFYEEFQYYVINKPAGYICANEDKKHPTIIEYAPEFIMYNLHTVGRLDKDTTGVLLLTNDGRLTHQLISPKSEVEKVYIATTNNEIPLTLINEFAKGVNINNEYTTLPAKLEIMDKNIGKVTVVEGKYHQIKRMFSAFGLTVVALHRESFGSVTAQDLPVGAYRRLTKEELASFK